MKDEKRERIRVRILGEMKRAGDPPAAGDLRKQRTRIGLTLQEAADLVGVTLKAWQHYESGRSRIPVPTWRLFQIIARRLDNGKP